MWKKLGVVLVALVSTFSVVYAINNEIFATEQGKQTFNAGGVVTGRVNKAPTNLIIAPGSTNIGLKKGDKVLIGVNNPKTGSSLGWQLLTRKENYTEVITTNTNDKISSKLAESSFDKYAISSDVLQHSAWFTMSTDSINKATFPNLASSGFQGTKFYLPDYDQSGFASVVESLNHNLVNAMGYKLVESRYLGAIKHVQNADAVEGQDYDTKATADLIVGDSKEIGRKAFAPDMFTTHSSSGCANITSVPGIGLGAMDLTFKAEYFLNYLVGTQVAYINSGNGQIGYTSKDVDIDLRPAIMLTLDDVVFGISQGNSTGIASVESPSLPASYSSIYASTKDDGEMKLRVLNATLTAQLTSLKDAYGNVLSVVDGKSKFMQTEEIKINASANAVDNSIVSVLLFDKDGQLVYYKPLEKAKGTGDYLFDSTDVAIGEYQLAIVNENYSDTDTDIKDSSLISSVVPIKVVEYVPVQTITYTASPQTQDIYEYDKNVDKGTKIGTIARSDGIVPIHYEIVADESDNSYKNFEISGLDEKGDSSADSLDVKIKSSGAPDIVATTNSLKTGVHKFCIESTDANGSPSTQVLGKTKICTSLVVYPGDSQIIYNQKENSTTKALYTKEELNALSIGTTVATANFSDGSLLDDNKVEIADANIDLLETAGYTIKEVKLLKQGTTTPLDELEAKAIVGNVNQFEIKKKSGATFTGDITFDIQVVFQYDGEEVATILKSNQVFVVPAGLKFVNPENSQFLTTSAYTFTWNSNANNQFIVMATDNTTPTTANNKVTYCILDASKECTTSSTVLSFISGGSTGTQKVQANAPSTADKNVMVRAMVKNASNQVITYSDINLTIHPASQTLTWEGTNIQGQGNDITKDSAKHNTWNLNLKYDKDTAANNIHTSSVIIKDVSLVDKTITLRDKVESGVAPNITYVITCSDSDDTGKVIIDDTIITKPTLTITDELKGDVTITASAAAVGNYHESKLDDATTSNVNEDERATLILSVSSKAKVNFTPSYENSFDTSSTYAKGTAGLGSITLDPTTETGYTYDIESVKQLNKTTGEYDTIDSSKFLIKKEGSPEKDILYAKAGSTLSAGTYKVQIKATKGNEKATPKEITIVVTPASINVSKLKWTQKDKISDTYGDMDGEIDKDTSINTETLSKKYQNIDGVEGTFYVNVDNKEDTLLSNATIKYALSSDSTSGVIEVAQDGKVTMKGASKSDTILFINATISKEGYNDSIVKLPVTIEKGDITDFKFAKKNGTLYELDGDKKDITKYATQTYTYAQGKDGLLDIFTKGAPAGSDVTIKITANGASKGNDVLKFNDSDASKNSDSDNPKECVISKDDYTANRTKKCQVMIENALANQTSDKGKIVLSASIDESDNYKAITLSMKVNITQASNSDFGYAEKDTIEVESNTNGAIEPIFQTKDETHPNIGTGKIMLMLEKQGEDPGYTLGEVELNPNEFDPDNKPDNPYFNGYRSYVFDIVVDKDASAGRTIYLYAQKLADRNYAASEVKTLTVKILREDESSLNTTITSYPQGNTTGVSNKITYGDTYFKLETVSPDDTDDPAATYTYELEESAEGYIERYGSNSNEFKPLKAGDKVKVKIKRTSGTGIVSNTSKTLGIQPKSVKLKVDNISKKAGMSIDVSEYAFTKDSDTFLAIDKDKLNMSFSCLDTGGNDVSTLRDGIRIVHNNLPITALIENKDAMDDVLSNYKIVHSDGKTLGVENGKLTVSETDSNISWYEVKEGSNTNASSTVKDQDNWFNGPVDVILKTAAGSYNQIAPEDKAEAWKNDKFEVTTEGNNAQAIYFRMSSGADKGSITKPQEEVIKIDTVAPEVKEIKAKLTHTDAFSKLINAISFGSFMKPGEEVTIHTKDVQSNPDIEVSTTNSVKTGIHYDVYTLDSNGDRDTQIITNEKLDTNDKGEASFTFDKPGVYEVCAIVKDQASNSSSEKCEKLLVKKIDVDVDQDGTLDFNDSDSDGCPDISIVWKNEDGTWTKLNVDIDDDKLPELNIDTRGVKAGSSPDGKADINIDTDDDGVADLNIVDIKSWNPEICVTGQIEEYCTDNSPIPDRNIDLNGDGRPDINIDLNDDGIPDIDIDTDGDGKRDINIDTNQDGTADEKLKVMKEWILDDKVFEVSGQKFHTMTGLVEDKIDKVEDGGIVVKPGEGQVFLPNYALKVTDKTDQLDEETKNNIQAILPDKSFKKYLKIDLTKDSVVIQPDGKVSISIPIEQGIKNPKVMIEQADGTFVEATGTLKDGIFTYETTFVGGVVVFGDNIEEEPKELDPISPNLPTQKKPDTSVKGNYVGGMGGAGTGDATSNGMLLIGVILSITTLFFLTYKRRKEE